MMKRASFLVLFEKSFNIELKYFPVRNLLLWITLTRNFRKYGDILAMYDDVLFFLRPKAVSENNNLNG